MASPLEFKGIRPTGEVLGSGSYGEVIEVEWCNTICAAKRMHDIFLCTLSPVELDKMVKDFEKECQIWSSLRHPNIVLLLGIYHPPKSRVPQFVLEKMDTSLRHYLEGHSREEFLLPDKVSILRQVAQGLCYLHSQNPPLVHHDLSPNNILLNEWTFQTKLTDFGMTRAINLSKLTRKSSVKGTFAFMSPEALDVPPRYTEKLDVFSFGNCIATTLTHEWPNPSHPTAYDKGNAILRTEFERRIHQIDQMSSREKDLFLPLVRRCLEGDATIRPSSAELVSAMKQIESTLQSTEPSKIKEARQAMSQLSLERQQKTQLQQQLEEEHQRYQTQLTQLQQENTQLQQENTQLQQENTDNAQLKGQMSRLQQTNTQLLLWHRRLHQQVEEERSKTEIKQVTKQLRDWKKISTCRKVIKDGKVKRNYTAVAVNEEGMLAALDVKNSCICLFDREGELMKTIKVKSTKSGHLLGAAFTKKGHIAVSDYSSVLIYSVKGERTRTIQVDGRPSALAVSNAGYIYICEGDRHCISVYSEEGEFQFEFGSQGNGPGQFGEIDYLSDMSFGPDGRLCVCNKHNKMVHIYIEDGSYAGQFQTLDEPSYLCMSHDGHVIVVEGDMYNFVSVYDTNYQMVHMFQLDTNYHGVAVNGEGDIYVAGWKNGIYLY